MEADSAIKLATLKFSPRENSGPAEFSILNNETHDSFVTESGSETQIDLDTSARDSREIKVVFELISYSTYSALT